MKLGIMQPYTFPYIGYFQQINLVDKFVVYDDVTFIKQGWINRNRILLNGRDHIFTVPLKDASSFRNIRDTEINQKLYALWLPKFLKTLTQAYSKAPMYKQVYDLVANVFNEPATTISELAVKSITETCSHIGIDTQFLLTSTGYNNNDLKAKDRVLDICHKEHASVYINPIGGKELYSKQEFAAHGLELHFVRAANVHYRQFSGDFIPSLSIIDVMMFNSPEAIQDLLKEYVLE